MVQRTERGGWRDLWDSYFEWARAPAGAEGERWIWTG